MAPPSPTPTYIYKILPEAPPSPLPKALPLSPLDASDGFVHLSTAEQTPATVGRFFADRSAVWILKITLKKLEDGPGEVKWEDTKSHGAFAHLYGGDIGKDEVEEVLKVEKGESWDSKSWDGLL